MVRYNYDAWGNHTVTGSLASSIGYINPFRYRGYFYDIEAKSWIMWTGYFTGHPIAFLYDLLKSFI